jgi:hypothetical protein
MGILARAMRGDRVDRATRSSAGRNLRPRDYPRPDGTAVVEHWLNQGITGHSRWIELAWLSIAASLLAILISEVWPRARKEEPYAPQRGTLSGPRRRALNSTFAGRFGIPCGRVPKPPLLRFFGSVAFLPPIQARPVIASPL